MRKLEQTGIALISVLPAIVLINFCIAISLFFSIKFQKIFQLSDRHQLELHQANFSLITQLEHSAPQLEKITIYKRDSPNITRKLITLGSIINTLDQIPAILVGSENPNYFPVFDFSKIFKVNTRCSGEQNNRTITALGFTLTHSSFINQKLCRQFEGINIAGNLALENFEPSTEISSVTTLGYLDLGILKLSKDLILLSSGDIHIGSIQNLTQNPFRLSLITSTGTVVVDNISDTVSLQVLAWTGAYLPPNAQFSQNLSTENFILNEEVLSISRP